MRMLKVRRWLCADHQSTQREVLALVWDEMCSPLAHQESQSRESRASEQAVVQQKMAQLEAVRVTSGLVTGAH